MTRQEVVDGSLITTSCPSSDEEVLLILFFNKLSFLIKLDTFDLLLSQTKINFIYISLLMKQQFVISIIILLFTLGFSACKKQEADDIPVVTYIKPNENQLFTVGDTVDVVFDVSSISNITSIQIALVDLNLKPVTKLVSYKLLNGKNNGKVQAAVIIDDLFLPAANYKIQVQVFNKKDQKAKYQNIIVNSFDKKLLSYCVLTKQPNYIKVWDYSLSFQKSLINTMTGDYGSSDYMPFHNRMVLSAKTKGSFTIWDYLLGDTVLNVQASPSPPFPYYTGTAIVNNQIACLYYADKFEFYAFTGNILKTINYKTGYYPEKVFDVGADYISIEVNKSGLQRRLLTHLSSTGYINSYYILQGPVIAALPFDNKDFMMFSNYNGTGQIELFIWNNNSATRPIAYNGDEFIDAVAIGNKQYLILTKNEVLWYRYASSSITSLLSLSVNNPIKIRFDKISNTIYIIDNQGFSLYSYPSGNLLSDHRVSEEVLNLHLIYNR